MPNRRGRPFQGLAHTQMPKSCVAGNCRELRLAQSVFVPRQSLLGNISIAPMRGELPARVRGLVRFGPCGKAVLRARALSLTPLGLHRMHSAPKEPGIAGKVLQSGDTAPTPERRRVPLLEQYSPWRRSVERLWRFGM